MDKYWEKLFADPFVVNTPEGQVRSCSKITLT